MKKSIVITSRFNFSDPGLLDPVPFRPDPLSPDWIKNRMHIFMNYTRKSFEAQTNQDFLAVLSCYEESMPLIQSLLKDYPPLPSHIIFTSNKRPLIENYIKGSDLLYLIHIDSDDLYHKDFIQKMYDYTPAETTSCLICTTGYVYNTSHDLLASYFNHSPCFYTQIFSVSDYLGVYQYYPELSHGYASAFPYEPLAQARNFILVVHGGNTWQYFGTQYNHALITDPNLKNTIKQEFGLT